jgi:fibronectin type 3 domain-containing protein
MILRYKSPLIDNIRIIFFIVLLLPGIGNHISFSQIHIIGRSCPDSICLRWASADFEGWSHGNRSGYSILRTTIISNGELQSSAPEKLNKFPIKPLPLAQWKFLTEQNEYAAIAAQAIYGTEFIVTAGTERSNASIINIANDQEARVSFGLFAADQSLQVARAAGLCFTDSQVVPGEKYLYRIFFDTPLPGYKGDTALLYTGPDEYIPLPKPLGFKGESGDRTALLHWNQKYLESFYTSYILERSDDYGMHFSAVNDHPLVKTNSTDFPQEADMVYIDSIPLNYHNYFYRLRGKTSFGESGPWSDSVVIAGINGLSSFPVITDAMIDTNGNISLRWILENNSENQLPSYFVLRSESDYGPADTIYRLNPAEPACYVDTSPKETNYYRIVACARFGNCRSSFSKLVQLPDTVAPETPEFLCGKVDTSGSVFLQWKPNPEKDIYGYRIYRSTKTFEEPSLLTRIPVKDTFFIDTVFMDNLNEEVSYSIMALDKRQNHSPLTEPFKIIKPDMIPPSFPQIISAISSSNGIIIKWIPGASTDIDHYNIIRIDSNKDEKCIACLRPPDENETSYIDTTTLPAVYYTYYIQAFDDAGHHTNSPTSATSLCQSTGKKMNSNNWSIKAERDAFKVLLILKEPSPTKILVYKGEDENKMKITGCIHAGIMQWADSNLIPGTKYFYLLVKLEDTGERKILGSVKNINF